MPTTQDEMDAIQGGLKQKCNNFTDDGLQQIEGGYDKVVGKAQERYSDKTASS